MKRSFYPIFVLLLATFTFSCSTKKNTALNRFWHRTNTHYNGWFNGNQAMKYGIQDLSKSRKDDFTKVVPVFEYGGKANWTNQNASWDRTIKKAVTMIKKHSMLINGKQYNKYIDDCYLMMGKAHFFKQEFGLGVGQLRYVSENSEKQSTRNEAKIWMIKTYSEMGEFADAGIIMRSVDAGSLGKLEWQYHAAVADFYIKQKEWDKAIESLDNALRNVKQKSRKARFEFVKAQVYQQLKSNKDAYDAYTRVLKNRPDYDLEFQSKIQLAMTSENTNNDELRKVLTKMLRDAKNIEFQDQIYYALAVIDLKENKKPEAIADLKKSVKYNVDNQTQKALSYLKLAEIYFADRNYEPAQAYYDSTAAFIDKENPKYDEVMRLKENLTLVVDNIRTVELQDSLQRLGKMGDDELKEYLENYVEQLKLRDEEAKNNPETNPFNPGSGGVSQGQSYFVNQQLLALGRNDFKKVWGNRILEDDWRRSDKSSNTIVDGGGGVDEEQEDPRYNVDTYMSEIPRTDSAFQASNALIYSALYNLGLVYKEKILDYPRSAEAFEDLVSRNTTNEHFPITYYQLYLVYNLMRNDTKSEEYKQIIITQYPESEYAQMLSNPGYSGKKDDDELAEPLYKSAYDLYKNGLYDQSLSASNSAMQQYPESKMKHRFALLSALNIGKLQPQENFIAALDSVKSTYAGTESANTADRILALLKSTPGKTDSVSSNTLPPVSAFNYDPKAEHMIVLIVEDPAKKLETTLAYFASFNDKSFPLKSLGVTNTLMGKGYQLLTVRKFTDAKDAMLYYKEFMKQGGVAQLRLNVKTYLFAISIPNYAILFKDQNVSGYETFFNQNYDPSN